MQMVQLNIEKGSVQNFLFVAMLPNTGDFAYTPYYGSHASLNFAGLVSPGGGIG